MSDELIKHIIELKEGQASIRSDMAHVKMAVLGNDGSGGLIGRVSSLEHARTGVRSVVATGSGIGAVLGWFISHFFKAN